MAGVQNVKLIMYYKKVVVSSTLTIVKKFKQKQKNVWNVQLTTTLQMMDFALDKTQIVCKFSREPVDSVDPCTTLMTVISVFKIQKDALFTAFRRDV